MCSRHDAELERDPRLDGALAATGAAELAAERARADRDRVNRRREILELVLRMGRLEPLPPDRVVETCGKLEAFIAAGRDPGLRLWLLDQAVSAQRGECRAAHAMAAAEKFELFLFAGIAAAVQP